MKTGNIKYLVFFFIFFLSGSWLLPGGALADYGQHYGWGPGMMGWGLMSWFGPWGMILFWVLLVLLIAWLVKGFGSSKGSTGAVKPAEESALEILKRRYARGEINKEEYLEKKKDLE
jgi:putative membrane protein